MIFYEDYGTEPPDIELTAEKARKKTKEGIEHALMEEWAIICKRVHNAANAGCYSATVSDIRHIETIQRLREVGFTVIEPTNQRDNFDWIRIVWEEK